MGGVQLMFPQSLSRAGTWGFYMYVASGMLVMKFIKPEYVGKAGIATGAYVMASSNYIHPFNRGPNPLKYYYS